MKYESSPQPVVDDSITGDVINANKQKMRRLRKDPLERDDDMELRCGKHKIFGNSGV